MLRQMLSGLAVRMFLDRENGFTIERLHALAHARGLAAEVAYGQLRSAGVAERVPHLAPLSGVSALGQ